MTRHRLCLILLLLCPLCAAALDMGSRRHVSSAQGLSNDFVLSLAVDGDGYVWAATEAGLTRIAGSWCRVVDTGDGNGQRICSVFYHQATELLLIGTENGLCIYDTRSDRLLPAQGVFDYSLDNIAPASDGGVWLVYGDGRVQHFDCSTRRAEELALSERFGNRCALDDGQGRLYLGHAQQGMSIVNLADGSSQRFIHQPADTASLPGNNVRCIASDGGGRLWVGTDHGLARFDPATGRFAKVKHANGDYDDNVYDIRLMADGSLWVATDMGGVRVLGRERLGAAQLRFDTTTVQTSSLNVRSIVEDEFGNVWVGNHSRGVDFFAAQRSLFSVMGGGTGGRPRPVYALAATADDGMWMGCEDELQLWRHGRVEQRWPLESAAHREHSFPRCVMADSQGGVWLGMEDEGAVRFTPADGRFRSIDIGHPGADIHSFAEDGDGRIWIGSEYGVFTYYNGTVAYEEDISRITHRAPVTTFIMLDAQRMLLTTQGMGVYTVDRRTKDYVSLMQGEGALPSNKVNQATADRSGGVWLATAKGLAYVADAAALTGVTVYDSGNGLADNHVRALRQDDMGRIWVSTFSGVACLNRASGRFHNYDYFGDQHLNGFAQGAAVALTDGTICFGSASGLCLFSPQDFNSMPKASQVQLIACEAYSPVGSDTEIVTLMPDARGRVVTSYEQNTLRLAFTLRDYAQTGREEYSYKMRGMDDKWYYIGDDQDVVFRGLRPGRYTFVLRAKLKSQEWDEATVTQLEIRITPPFWKTWWACLLYVLAAVLWGAYALRSYKRKLALQGQLELEKRQSQQQQELNEERLRFFTNVTHELRTPLTLILGPLDDLMADGRLPQPAQRKVAMIQKSAQQLRNLINGILEFRKTETQNRRLTVARGDVGQLLRELCMNYKELYRNPRVCFTYDIPDTLPPIYFDSEMVTTIMNNLISNAIKYTEQGTITVRAKAADGNIAIDVADTGYGIPAQVLPHIFDRYYQVKGKHQASGTGIGLALAKALADLHEALLSVESREGHGSTFTLKLSTEKSYPAALHKEDAPSDKAATEADADDDASGMPTLLVVEDNADIRQYIADSFADDYRILQADNGEQGLLMARQHVPDIIVSDIMMPRMDGVQMTRLVKEDLATCHIPVILLTAKVADEDKEEGYLSGADSYLTKPFTAKLLATRIQNLLAARRRLADWLTANPATTLAETAAQPAMSRLDSEFIRQLEKVVEENIMKADIDMAFLTDKMAMSHSTFYRKVKALTGLTATEYIRKLRLRHCYRLIESGDYNVGEAAMMTGFNQMAHFRDVFRREFGILPSEVRRKNTQQGEKQEGKRT